MAKFDEITVKRLFQGNLKAAEASLAGLDFCCCKEASFKGLNGWVFEQTVERCLQGELGGLGSLVKMQEQSSLGGRKTADLLVGTVAIELKTGGLFDRNAAARYGKHRVAAEGMGDAYLYLTLTETYVPYRNAVIEALGRRNAFFLDMPGEWPRFIDRIEELLRSHATPTQDGANGRQPSGSEANRTSAAAASGRSP